MKGNKLEDRRHNFQHLNRNSQLTSNRKKAKTGIFKHKYLGEM